MFTFAGRSKLTCRKVLYSNINEQTPRDNARFYVECATLGIVFIYAGLTAIQARQSIKATDIARESLESVQRAFVDPTVSFDSTLNPQKTLASEMIIIHLENSGSTPAKVLKSRSNIAFVTELPNGFNFPDVLGNDSHPIVPSTYIAPKANVTSTPVILDQGQIDLIVSGKMHLYLWGWIRYRDVFSKTEEHITRYSYEIKAVRSKSEGVEYITFGGIAQRYACADEQCKNQ
jgi:hypothetical protein